MTPGFDEGISKCTLLSPQLASKCLANKAFKKSSLNNYSSPFTKASIAANTTMIGGKEDDITVIIA